MHLCAERPGLAPLGAQKTAARRGTCSERAGDAGRRNQQSSGAEVGRAIAQFSLPETRPFRRQTREIQGKNWFSVRFSGTGALRSGLNLPSLWLPRAWLFLQKMASSPSCFCPAAAGRGILSETCSGARTKRPLPQRRQSPTETSGFQLRAVKTKDRS